MAARKEPTDALRAARRAVDGMAGVELPADWAWHEGHGKWVLHSRLSPEFQAEGPIPPHTDWCVLAAPDYPWGSIKFYPAKDGGITRTFHHQSFNGEGGEDVPWRTGDLCLSTVVRSLGRHGRESEPYEAESRLQWHFSRALEWLRRASDGDLVRPGDPFELPAYQPGGDIRVAFSEGADSFARWQDTPDASGTVELVHLDPESKYLVVKSFRSLRDKKPILAPKWGQVISEISSQPELGVWLRLNDTLALDPWHAPCSWGELGEVCARQGVDIMGLLQPVANLIRDRKRHIALIGFPVPPRFGEAPCQMHWQSVMLPVLSHGKYTANGFRPNSAGHWLRDKTEILVPKLPLSWLASENWHSDQISTRGKLSENLRKNRVLIIGAGAVGAPLAELLVRGGVYKVGIADGDSLSVGNLVRHTLSLGNLGENKAGAVAERLNTVSPLASAEAIACKFPPTDQADMERVQQYDMVIDCTADDQVLHHLEQFPWNSPRFFFSVWLGFKAERMYCFSAYRDRFPYDEFRSQVDPWLLREHEQFADEDLPWEGIGCWHPVFPATVDDTWMMASIAAKSIDARVSGGVTEPSLDVFEQCTDESGLTAVHAVAREVEGA